MDRYFIQLNNVWIEVPSNISLDTDYLKVTINDRNIYLNYIITGGFDFSICRRSSSGHFYKFWLPEDLLEPQNFYAKDNFSKFRELIAELKNQYG